jgi:hypothetical protein
MSVDPIQKNEKDNTEELLAALQSSVGMLNGALLQMTKDGVSVWQSMEGGNYKAEQAFQDAAVMYARSVTAWRELAKVWTGYSRP